MIFIWLVELAMAVAVLWGLATQVAVPVLQGTRVFPALRPRRSRADYIEDELRRVNDEGLVQALDDEVTARREALARHRAKAAADTKPEGGA